LRLSRIDPCQSTYRRQPDGVRGVVEHDVGVDGVDRRYGRVESPLPEPNWVDQSFVVVPGEPHAICSYSEHSRHVSRQRDRFRDRIGRRIDLLRHPCFRLVERVVDAIRR
jgi:hypothetical protein